LQDGDLLGEQDQVSLERHPIHRDRFRGEVRGKDGQQRQQIIRPDGAIRVRVWVVGISDRDGVGRCLAYSKMAKKKYHSQGNQGEAKHDKWFIQTKITTKTCGSERSAEFADLG
jgi:hypothetical protein